MLSHLGRWEDSLKSLAAAQAIDFDPDSEPLRKAVSARVSAIEAEKVQQRLAEQEALREKVKKQREELAQRRKEEEEEEVSRASREMPVFHAQLSVAQMCTLYCLLLLFNFHRLASAHRAWVAGFLGECRVAWAAWRACSRC